MLGDGGEYVSIVPVVYPRGIVIVSSLGSFSSIGSSSISYLPSLPESLVGRHIQAYFINKRGRKRRFIKPYQEKARH